MKMLEKPNFKLAVDKCLGLIDQLLKTRISASDFDVILYLVVVWKEKVALDVQMRNDHNIAVKFSSLNVQRFPENSGLGFNHMVLHKIHDAFENILEQIDYYAYGEIAETLTSLPQDVLEFHFQDLFDAILNEVSKIKGKGYADILEPVELTNVVWHLAGLETRSSVFHPFAGSASLATLMKQQTYYGQELFERTWAIGTLRLIAHRRIGESWIDNVDSVKNWPSSNIKFDLIYANIPFNLRSKDERGRQRLLDEIILELGIHSLKENGKLIMIIPNGFLTRKGAGQVLRRKLIENDLIDTVIAFPGGILRGTSIPFSLLFINLEKQHRGFVKVVDASTLFVITSNKERRLSNDLIKMISQANNHEAWVKLVPNRTIEEYGYDLMPGRFFIQQSKGIRIGDIVTRLSVGRVTDKGTWGKYVSIKNLRDDQFDYELSISDVPVIEISNAALRLNQSGLLIASRGNKLKPTFFKFTGEPLYLSRDIYALSIDTSVIDPDYFVNELHGEDIFHQIQKLRIGETVPTLRFEDFASVRIELPSLEAQKGKISGLKQAHLETQRIQLLEQTRRYGFEKQQYEEFASLKHSLGTPLQNILSNSSVLESFFQSVDVNISIIRENFKDRFGTSISNVLASIKDDLQHITTLLDQGENGLVLDNFAPAVWSLAEIEQEIVKFQRNRYNFKINILLTSVGHENDVGIFGDVTLLKILIENILQNANKHGFDSFEPQNEVVLQLDVLDNRLILDIKNNGRAFPKGYSKEKFITKYATTDSSKGSGIGGYDINRIAQYLNADWDLILNEDPIYKVRFRFEFPLIDDN